MGFCREVRIFQAISNDRPLVEPALIVDSAGKVGPGACNADFAEKVGPGARHAGSAVRDSLGARVVALLGGF